MQNTSASTATSHMQRVRDVVSTLAGLITGHARASMAVEDDPTLGTAFATALESLGVTFIKLGQTLSTRPDLLPAGHIDALQRLRDDVAPLSPESVREVLELGLPRPPHRVFGSFDFEPIGCGSVGQVHTATLPDGRPVAVKVQRPDARPQVEQDLHLLGLFARQVGNLSGNRQLETIVDTFGSALRLELDYRIEAQNLNQMRELLHGQRLLSCPAAHAALGGETVLIMDLVDGVPLHDAQIIPNGRALARAVCGSYLDQIVQHGFLHADPHPGNLLLTTDGRLHLIDLGMVEHLGPDERDTVAELIIGMTDASPRQVSAALDALCTPTDSADLDQLQQSIRLILSRSDAMRGIQPTFGATLMGFLEAVSAAGYEPPAQLATLGRTLSMLDEVITCLDPTFDPGSLVEENSNQFLWRRLFDQLDSGGAALNGLALAKFVRQGPTQVARLLDQLSTGHFTVTVDAFDEERTLLAIRKIANRIAGSVLVASLLISGAMLQNTGVPLVFGMSLLSVAFLLLGGLGAATLLLSILWYDR